MFRWHGDCGKWIRNITPVIINMKILEVILSILLPPVGVLLKVGLTKHFWINLILTLLGYLPGIIHALYVILRDSSESTHV